MGFPNLPGVPSLKGVSGGAVAVTLAAPLINNLLDKLKPAWGIYDAAGKKKVIEPDSFLGVDYQNESNVSNYPIERGAFSSYNKVRTPFSAVVKISKGGAIKDRDAFIKVLEQLAASLDVYTIITPETSYFNVNLEEYDYRREVHHGAGIVIASMRFVEIIEASVLLPSSNVSVPPDKTATVPSAQSMIDNGMCQAAKIYASASPYLNLSLPFASSQK